MRTKHRRCLAASCLAAALCGLLFWLLTPPERNLFKRAQIVEPREDFVFPARVGRETSVILQGDWPYCWLSPSMLFTVHYGPTSIINLDARLTNIDSGHREPAAFLSEFARNYAGGISGALPDNTTMNFVCLMSPNARWLLASRRIKTDGDSMSWGDTRSIVSRTDGKRLISWQTPDDLESAAWMRDGHRWVGIVPREFRCKIMVVDVDAPERTLPRTFDLKMKLRMGCWAVCVPALAGTMPDGRLLAVDWKNTSKGQVRTARFFPETEAGHPAESSIPVPAGSASVPIAAPVLSPDGNRLAWFVFMQRIPAGWPATRSFWKMWKMAPSTQIGLWTTRPDGSDPMEVGMYTPKDNYDLPSLLQWTPDGRYLSFRHQGALYRIPAR